MKIKVATSAPYRCGGNQVSNPARNRPVYEAIASKEEAELTKAIDEAMKSPQALRIEEEVQQLLAEQGPHLCTMDVVFGDVRRVIGRGTLPVSVHLPSIKLPL
jgi:hypothetical protein